jgi:putative FmdB family regulatory protein
MPIYEYQCRACGHELEALQKMSDDALEHCPECNDPTLKKKISVVGFQLKGTGWYETDFKNSGAKPKEAKNKQSKGEKTDKKPAAKPAKKHSSGTACNQAA